MWSRRTVRSLFLLPVLAVGIASAHAASDQDVSWSDLSLFDLGKGLNSNFGSEENLKHPTIDPSATSIALRDADRKLDPLFHVPPHLEASTRFWFRIYTEWTTEHVVLFDRQHPELVYEVLELGDLWKRSRNRMAFEILSKRRIDSRVKAYRAAFARLKRNPKGPFPKESLESTILSAIAQLPAEHRQHPITEFGRSFRTQTGQRDNVVKGLVAAETYLPQMERIFKSSGVPVEITRLALVESSFNLNATSRVGAAGVWQFMERSARDFLWLEPQKGIDERRSPLKSTVAAAKLLKRHHKILRDWPLAIVSYNHGLRSFVKIPREKRTREGVASFFEPCNRKSPLGWASRNYYPEFLALLHAEAYRHLFYGEIPARKLERVVFEKVENGQTAHQFAQSRGMSAADFRIYNPDLRALEISLPKGFWIAIPANLAGKGGFTADGKVRKLAPQARSGSPAAIIAER